VQNGVIGGAHERDAVVANIASLVEKARRDRVPVVWVQHSDEPIARGVGDSVAAGSLLVPGEVRGRLCPSGHLEL
jgi:nicotinamidase-related amidase